MPMEQYRLPGLPVCDHFLQLLYRLSLTHVESHPRDDLILLRRPYHLLSCFRGEGNRFLNKYMNPFLGRLLKLSVLGKRRKTDK